MRRDPFEMLERCHRRLEETLESLRTPTRQTLDEALAFIDRAVKRHETDEEQSLFPRLSRVPQLAGLLDRLTVQHREQTALVDQLRTLMEAARARRRPAAHRRRAVSPPRIASTSPSRSVSSFRRRGPRSTPMISAAWRPRWRRGAGDS